MQRRVPLVLAVALLLLPSGGRLSAQTAVRVGVYDDNKPLVFQDASGKWQGLCIDVLEYAAAREGWRLQYIRCPWSECLEALEKGDLDLLVAIAWSSERSVVYDFNTWAVVPNWGQVFVRPGTRIESFLDLEGKSVALVRDDIYALALQDLLGRFEVDSRLIWTDDFASVFTAVAEGEAQAGVTNRLFGVVYSRKYGIHPTPVIFSPIEIRFAAPKGKGKPLLAAVDRHLEAGKRETGSFYYRALERWLGEDFRRPLPPWAAAVLIGAGVALALFVTGYFLLRAQVRAKTRALQSESEERRKVEERLHQAQKMEAIGQMAGGIAHDFNNLLTPILGYVDLLLDRLSPAEDAWEKLKEIQRAGLRARDLVSQLLAFGRRQILELRIIDLNVAISESRAMLRRTIREDIDIRYNLAAESSRVVADPTQLLRVLMNLAINAQDAMPDGGVLTVETGNRQLEGDETDLPPDVEAGHYVQLVVRDTGVGMTPETRERIFEPFFTTKEGGTGLGLAAVFGAVRQHRGFVEVSSETAGGISFSICLPASSEAAASPRQKPPSAAGSIAGLELYVVEDDELVRELTVTLLREGGYRVRFASSAEECLKEFGEGERPVHLLVTDVIMPGMNGKQLYERLRGSHPDLRVLYLSGYGGEFIAQIGVLEEKVALLRKPFTEAELQAKVLEVLAGGAPDSAGGSA